MTFVAVKELPRKRRYKHSQHAAQKDLIGFITDFLESGAKYAKVEYDDGEYVTPGACQSALRFCAIRNSIPIVKVTVINGEVYLIRTDMED